MDARSVRVAVVSLMVTVLVAACGSSTPPTSPTPTPTRASGVWLGEQTVTDFTGGECLAPAFEGFVGLQSQFHATLTQSGSSLMATLDIDHTGGVCTYAGTIEGNELQLSATDCTESKAVGFRCPNGDLRDVLQGSEILHARVEGDTITGTAQEIDDIVVSGTSQRVATLVSQSTFRMARQ